jgi:hypothetical protein
MRKILSALVLALFLWPAHPARLAAWGFTGHRFITDKAVDLLPDQIRPFFRKYRTRLVEHAIDPDTYRTMGFTEEPPRHFMDMDNYGPFPFASIPHDYSEAVARRGLEFVVKNGIVPWRTQEIYDHLRDAFKKLPTSSFSRDDILLFSAVVAHYTEDAFQPFHACANYDGQLTHQQGIHARFESDLFDRYGEDLHLSPSSAVYVPDAREFIFATLTDSYRSVQPILDADRAAAEGRTVYDDEYFAQFFKGTRPILEKRVSGAISGVASLIMSAWIDAGKPALPPEAPPRPPKPIRR